MVGSHEKGDEPQAGGNMPLPQEALNGIIAGSMVIGVIECFFGYRIFKFVLGLTGFILGGIAAASIASTQSHDTIVMVFAALGGGVAGAVLLVVFYFIGVCLVGAFLGATAGAVLLAASSIPPEPVMLLVMSVIGGVLALIFQKFMIILSTAFGGAWSVVIGTACFTTNVIDPTSLEHFFRSRGSQFNAILLCWLVLGLVGVIVQYHTAKGKKTPARMVPAGENFNANDP